MHGHGTKKRNFMPLRKVLRNTNRDRKKKGRLVKYSVRQLLNRQQEAVLFAIIIK
jgi:hypothetical protein